MLVNIESRSRTGFLLEIYWVSLSLRVAKLGVSFVGKAAPHMLTSKFQVVVLMGFAQACLVSYGVFSACFWPSGITDAIFVFLPPIYK